MSLVIDSDVLIDCLRGTAEARAWLATMGAADVLVPGIVALELLAGCRNRAEQRSVVALLERFGVVWPEPAEGAAALDIYVRHSLPDGMGVHDAMVAAMALRRGASLLTFNRKHFGVVEGLLVVEPYQRA